MSLLPRIARPKEPEVLVSDLPKECGHWELAPRWENAEDIGKKDKITYFTCSGCKGEFTPEEAKRFAA
jgi:hypothetical protein